MKWLSRWPRQWLAKLPRGHFPTSVTSAQRRVVPSLIRPPGGVHLGFDSERARDDDVDVPPVTGHPSIHHPTIGVFTPIGNTTSAVITTADPRPGSATISSLQPAIPLITAPAVPPIDHTAIFTIVADKRMPLNDPFPNGLAPVTVTLPSPVAIINTASQQGIGINTTATATFIMTATISTPAMVNSVISAPSSTASASCGGSPRRGGGLAGGVVVWPLTAVPASGGGNGGGLQGAAASTGPRLCSVANSIVEVLPVPSPADAHPPSFSFVMLINDGNVGMSIDVSSLLPISSLPLISSISNCGRGGLSGIPH